MANRIDRRTIKAISELAMLEFSEEEEERILEELEKIASFSRKIQEISESFNEEPHRYLEMTNLREDLPVNFFRVKDIVEQAPKKENGMFKVPAVIQRVKEE